MKHIYAEHLNNILELENDTEKLTHLTSTLRSILQLSVVISLEIIKYQIPTDEDEFDLVELTKRFHKPADGLLIEILDKLTTIIRSYTNDRFLNGWFEKTKSIREPLSQQLQKWVEFRNKRLGHGVSDMTITTEWSTKTHEIIDDCIKVFSTIIPVIDETENLKLSNYFKRLHIITPVFRQNCAIVIMEVIVKKGVWKLKGQLLSLTKATEFTVNLPEDNIFHIDDSKSSDKYNLIEITSNGKEHTFFHNVPIRQTDIFEGRKRELEKLIEWINDEDSRCCLVYGDGGYGKTTLVLEMLNRFIESKYDCKNSLLPTIISYHTAKMTKWTEHGLVHLTSVNPVMDECIRELIRFFYPILPPEWYRVTGRQLLDKAVGVLNDAKLTRNDILLVIDNTENLAIASHEVNELGDFFQSIGRRVGRLIITSRRRELINATPIAIEGLSEMEGVTLMKRIAEEYNARPILQSGESTLRRVSSQLMNKPILLETLVKYIAHTNFGIKEASDKVFKKSSEDLLQFLYQDAWVRMNNSQKEVFLVIVQIVSPLNQISVGQACQEVGIQHSEFQSGLGETHFAVLTDYGNTYELEFVELAKRFFLQKFGELNQSDKDRIKLFASNVDVYTQKREHIEKQYRTDRVTEAFRSEYAKAAKVYVDKGDIKNAIEMYELAIKDDPVNSALYDRFSWLLLNKTERYEYAEKISQKAVELNENNCDALVGLALVNYRLGNISEGDKYIDKANKKGRTKSFCNLRKAIARYHKAKKEFDTEKKISLLEDTLEKLEFAERRNDNNNGYDAKNLNDITKYKNLTKSQLSTLKATRTRMQHKVVL